MDQQYDARRQLRILQSETDSIHVFAREKDEEAKQTEEPDTLLLSPLQLTRLAKGKIPNRALTLALGLTADPLLTV